MKKKIEALSRIHCLGLPLHDADLSIANKRPKVSVIIKRVCMALLKLFLICLHTQIYTYTPKRKKEKKL